jgi:phosphoglycerate dehydrogenase-like enzyme
MSSDTWWDLRTPALEARLRAVADVDPHAIVADLRANPALLRDADVLLTGWGVPRIAGPELELMPRLSAIVHAAGTVKTFLDPIVMARGIVVSSAAEANAIPVAEYTLAAVIFASKRATRAAHRYRTLRGPRDLSGLPPIGGNGIVVGVVAASRIGRRVIELLQVLDVSVLLADPYVTPDEAPAGLTDLDDLLRRADVVTLHAPAGPATHHMIGRRELALMRDGATLINTARGSLVDTEALTAELVVGRLDAILDVTAPEPLPPESPLYDLPNVLLTPHIAGALGNEIHRLGELAVAEVERLAAGRPLRHQVLLEDLERIA